MIYSAPSTAFEAVADGYATGLAGTIGVRVRDNAGADAVARTTAGIVEDIAGSGIYRASITAPASAGQFTVVWDDATGVPSGFATEDLVVTYTAPGPAIPAGPAPSLTYLQIQNMVLEDAFEEGKRADAKEWIRTAHRKIWDAGEWTFKDATATTVTIVAGVVTQPSDVADVYALYNSAGQALEPYYDVRGFYDRYNSLIGGVGIPEAYCVVGSSLVVGPAASGTLTGWQLSYRRSKPILLNDGDLSGFPDAFEMALVYGGKWIGFTLINNPFADDFKQLFDDAVQDLMVSYVSGIDRVGVQQPAYRPY